jgi:hypothetical protein
MCRQPEMRFVARMRWAPHHLEHRDTLLSGARGGVAFLQRKIAIRVSWDMRLLGKIELSARRRHIGAAFSA